MFHRLLPALAFYAAALPVFSETLDACVMTDDQSDCVRVIACIGDKGRWFQGRSFGRGTGTLAGRINDGIICSGSWTSSNAFGLGQADVKCSDGMTASVIYYYEDSYSGTAIGRGYSSDGQLIESWSGEHVLDYFRDGSPDAEAILKCGDYGIPIS